MPFIECPHMVVACYCGAPPNSPDCEERPQMETCRLLSEAHGLEPCDQDSEDAERCWRYQRARADALAAQVERLTKRLEEVVPTVMATTCGGCDYGGYPHCKEAAGLACSYRLTAERIWDALHLAEAKVEGDG